MSKTLVIAEKPSVGRDLANALPGAFAKDDAYLESDDYVVTWAVGHLVELAEPDDYDERLKKWRMADLPIIPDEFKLKPRDAKAQEAAQRDPQAAEARRRRPRHQRLRLRSRGRAHLRVHLGDAPGVDKPVERLWISSMTKQAIGEGFEKLRPGETDGAARAGRPLALRGRLARRHERHPRRRRSAAAPGSGGVVSLGRVQTPTLALMVKREREIQAFVPEPYWLVHGTFEAPTRAGYEGLWFEGDETRLKDGARADAIVAQGDRQGRDGRIGRAQGAERARPAPLRPHEPPARREPPLRLLGAPHAPGRPVALRGQEGAHLSAHELPLPHRRHGAAAQADGRDARSDLRLRAARALRHRARRSCRSRASSTTSASTTTTRSSRPTSSMTSRRFSDDERRIFDLVARRFLAVFHPAARYERTTVVTEVESEQFRTRGKVTLEAGWRGVYGDRGRRPRRAAPRRTPRAASCRGSRRA